MTRNNRWPNLGFTPADGTLNLEVPEGTQDSLGPPHREWVCPQTGSVQRLWPCSIEDELPGWVRCGTVVEILAPVHLRSYYSLSNCDALKVYVLKKET